MKGFVFTFDALFAAVIGITLALSFYLMLDEIKPIQAHAPVEKDLLAALEKTGKLETMSGKELANALSKHNRCGSLVLKINGVVEREAVACPCDDSGEFYSGVRSFVRSSGGVQEYGVAVLRTCLRD